MISYSITESLICIPFWRLLKIGYDSTVLVYRCREVAYDARSACSAGSGGVFSHCYYRRWWLETFSPRAEKRLCEFFSSWKALIRIPCEAGQFETWHWKNSFSHSMLGASVAGIFYPRSNMPWQGAFEEAGTMVLRVVGKSVNGL